MAMGLTYEDLATFPRPGTMVPQSLRFSSDCTHVLYLLPQDSSPVLDLWRFDIAQRRASKFIEAPPEETLSLEEELRRERGRMMWAGITRYQEVHGTVLFYAYGRLYVMKDGHVQSIEGSDDMVAVQLLPTGTEIVGVRDGDLWVQSLTDGSRQAVTQNVPEGVTRGISEYVAQEELDRMEGFWVSPDAQHIAYVEVDQRHLPEMPIVRYRDDTIDVERYRYPWVGEPNARVALHVVDRERGTVVELTKGMDDGYLARVAWDDWGRLHFGWLSRDQKRLQWFEWDPKAGTVFPLWVQEHPLWINLADQNPWWVEPDRALFTSEKDNLRSLYQYVRGSVTCIGSVPGAVETLLDVDLAKQLAYVLVATERGLERQVMALGLQDGTAYPLTKEPGIHTAVFSSDHRFFVDQVSALHQVPATRLRSFVDDSEVVIHKGDLGVLQKDLVVPELERIEANGYGLNVALYRPKGLPPAGGWPLVVSVYGGPRAQRVYNGWAMTADLQAQFLAQEGFMVLKCDGRGSYHQGIAFEAPLYRHFGTVELEDQVHAVTWLTSREPIDKGRVGVFGWSYGGYLTLMAMMKAPHVFRVGVAGAPVTDFRWYDTAYTERYMGTVWSNREGYDQASVFSYISGFEGKLLLIHGMIDENVHFRHTARLIEDLIEAGKDFDVVVLPHSRHAPRGFHLEQFRVRKTMEYFLTHLSTENRYKCR